MTEIARHWIDGAWLESELVTDSTTQRTGSGWAGSPTVVKPRPDAAVGAARRVFAGSVWGRDRTLRFRALLRTGRAFRSTRARSWR